MKKYIVFVFLISFFSMSSQTKQLAKVDKIIYSYSNITSVEELAKRIDYDFKTDIEKARALFTWISLNIKYEQKNPFVLKVPKTYIVTGEYGLKRKQKAEYENTLRDTFNKRMGVCKGYALLFHKVCTLLNIKNELIYGYARSALNKIGHVPTNKNHVWNAVKINNEWVFIDTTWASGYIQDGVWKHKMNTFYFNINKENLRLTHYPSETFWLNYLNQKPLKDFCYQPIITKTFIDSKAELVLPNKGIIKTQKNKSFKLNLKNLKSNTKILYKLGNSGKVKSPFYKVKNLVTSIKIDGTNKNNSLHIYFNSNLALSYKVEVE